MYDHSKWALFGRYGFIPAVDAVCKALDCQAGDILEYLSDEEELPTANKVSSQ